MEIWKDIEDFEGIYQISSLGRIKSLMGHSGKKYYKREYIKKNKKRKNGYEETLLSFKGNKKYCLIHRLVAKAFIKNIENKPEVNHKNGIKDDNSVKNLEWMTSSENSYHSYENKLQVTPKGNDHYLSKKVKQYNKEGNFIRQWGCIRTIEKELGITHQNIIACCKKKKHCKTAGGYRWEYV